MKKVGYESAEAAARTAWLRRPGSASLTGTAHLSSSGVLWAGSRLYRCHILLFHTCWKTLLEVFRICMLLLRSGLSFTFKILCNIVHLVFFSKFCSILRFCCSTVVFFSQASIFLHKLSVTLSVYYSELSFKIFV